MQAPKHQHTLNLGQAGLGLSASHHASPFSQGGTIPYHITDDCAAATIDLEADNRVQADPNLRQCDYIPKLYVPKDLEPRRRAMDHRPRLGHPHIVEPDHTLDQHA